MNVDYIEFLRELVVKLDCFERDKIVRDLIAEKIYVIKVDIDKILEDLSDYEPLELMYSYKMISNIQAAISCPPAVIWKPLE